MNALLRTDGTLGNHRGPSPWTSKTFSKQTILHGGRHIRNPHRRITWAVSLTALIGYAHSAEGLQGSRNWGTPVNYADAALCEFTGQIDKIVLELK